MRKYFTIVMLILPLIGCLPTVKVPVSTSLYAPFVTDQHETFLEAVGLQVVVPPDRQIVTQKPSGFVGGGVSFQFDLGNVLTGVTRDAIGDLFTDTIFITTPNPNISRERLGRTITVTYSELVLKFALSYASNKFDMASLSGKATIIVEGDKGEKVFEKTLSSSGTYEHTGVGGDVGSFDRAISMMVSKVAGDLKSDPAFIQAFRTKGVSPSVSVEERLEKLRELRQKALITQEDYDREKAKALADLAGK